MKLIKWILNVFKTEPVSYYTVDGHTLAPFPNMTDSELNEYEIDFNVPNRSFPNGVTK